MFHAFFWIFSLGMCVGQVWLIFSIPESHLKTLFPLGHFTPCHLAYIEWFSRFPAHPNPNPKLYKVSCAFAYDGKHLASVVPISLNTRSVHLFPKWRWNADTVCMWSYSKVLEECEVFYLNSFKDHHTFYNVYWI